MEIRAGDIWQWNESMVDADAGRFFLVIGTPTVCGMSMALVQDDNGRTTDWTLRTLARCASRVVEAPWE